MQNKYSKMLLISSEKNLLLKSNSEFQVLYKVFSDKADFSECCSEKTLQVKIPKGLQAEFIKSCEDIRIELLLQMNARTQSMTKIENLLARIRFIKLRFLL